MDRRLSATDTSQPTVEETPSRLRDTETKPRPRDAEATRARILQAAYDAFASKGLAGARVDEIAEAADINKRMIYVYFGNKEQLFLTVLEEAYADMRAHERALKLTDLAPRAALEKLVTFTWTYYLAHPGFLRLLNSENLHQARHVKASRKIREMHFPFVEMAHDILAKGAASGEFRPGVDPAQLQINISALGYYYLTNRYTASVVYNTDLGAPAALEKRHAVILDTILRYVLADPKTQLG